MAESLQRVSHCLYLGGKRVQCELRGCDALASGAFADAGVDGGSRGKRDTGVDGGSRSKRDAGVDGGSRGKRDAGVDGGSRGKRDAGVDGGSRGKRDAGVDGGSRGKRDAGGDGGGHAKRDAGGTRGAAHPAVDVRRSPGLADGKRADPAGAGAAGGGGVWRHRGDAARANHGQGRRRGRGNPRRHHRLGLPGPPGGRAHRSRGVSLHRGAGSGLCLRAEPAGAGRAGRRDADERHGLHMGRKRLHVDSSHRRGHDRMAKRRGPRPRGGRHRRDRFRRYSDPPERLCRFGLLAGGVYSRDGCRAGPGGICRLHIALEGLLRIGPGPVAFGKSF